MDKLLLPIFQLLGLVPQGSGSKYLKHTSRDGRHIVCVDDEIDFQGLLPLYHFRWYDAAGTLIHTDRNDYSACQEAPADATQVQLIVWGVNKDSGDIIRLFRYYRKTSVTDGH